MGFPMKAPDANDILRQRGAEGLRSAWDKEHGKGRENANGESHSQAGVSAADFVAYMPQHKYIFMPTGEMWPTASVNARVAPIPSGSKPMSASVWLDQNRPVEQMTWAPGEPALIPSRLISDGGWINRPGCTTFNLYRPPTIIRQQGSAQIWLDHGVRVFGDDAEHIVNWLAHRVQRPQEKINHAIVLGGKQGIGKDTFLEPVKAAVGPWNFTEVTPHQILGRFNGFAKSVILRVSEVRDLGDADRFAFYDRLKALTAAPPDVLRVDEKHIPEYAVVNVLGIIHTTNHLTDGIYLPPDDRRHFVAWSPLGAEDFDGEYWKRLYHWFAHGGNEIVADYLATLDISTFDPKAPPPKTAAFWAIVNASRSPEDADIADALDSLGRPEVTTLHALIEVAHEGLAAWLQNRANFRQVPYRMESCGYVPVRNQNAEDGLWKIAGRRQAIYAKRNLSPRDQITEALTLIENRRCSQRSR